MAQSYLKPTDYVGKEKQGKNPYPTGTMPTDEEKKKEFFLRYNNAVFTDYANNQCAIPFYWGDQRTIDELVAYRSGRQGNEKIKPWLLNKHRKGKDGKWITKMNVSWDPYDKLPQLVDIMKAKNIPNDFDPEFTCIDDQSMAAMENTRAALKFLIDHNTREFMEFTRFKTGQYPDPQMLGLQTEQDVDVFMETGGYTLQWQIAAQAAFKKSKIVSQYKEFQDRIFEDIITNPEGICGAKTYTEAATGLPKFRRVNMALAVLPYSSYNDFKNITYGGEIRFMTIGEIHKENPKLGSDQLLNLAKQFQWFNPGQAGAIELCNRQYGSLNMEYMPNNVFNIDPISRCKVIVLDMQWLSVDIQTHLKNDTTGIFKEVNYDYEVDKSAKKKGDYTKNTNVLKKYESLWIVGTEHFIKYGICEDVAYFGQDGDKTPKLDYKFAKHGNKSLVERSVAIVDDMHMILVKYRNAWATLPAAPAMIVQQHLIEQVFLNNQLQEPEDLLQSFIERGVFFVNGLDDHGDPLYAAGGMKPIDFADVSKMAQMLVLCSNELQVKVNELREVLGLQGGADGGQKNPYQGLGETELAFQAANESLLPTFNTYEYLYPQIVEDIIVKWQLQAQKKKGIKLSYSLLGEKNMKILELGKEFCAAAFNIGIRVSPSTQEKQNLLQSLQAQKALGMQTGGAQGLTTGEFMYIYDKVMAGLIKEAYYVISRIEHKKLSEARQIEQQNAQNNIQSQNQSALTKGQIDMQNIKEKGKQQIMNTLVNNLSNEIKELRTQLLGPQKEGQNAGNPALTYQTIDQNNQEIGEIISMTMEDEQGQQQQQEGQEGQSQPQEEMSAY